MQKENMMEQTIEQDVAECFGRITMLVAQRKQLEAKKAAVANLRWHSQAWDKDLFANHFEIIWALNGGAA
jgi:hypothetical protein